MCIKYDIKRKNCDIFKQLIQIKSCNGRHLDFIKNKNRNILHRKTSQSIYTQIFTQRYQKNKQTSQAQMEKANSGSRRITTNQQQMKVSSNSPLRRNTTKQVVVPSRTNLNMQLQHSLERENQNSLHEKSIDSQNSANNKQFQMQQASRDSRYTVKMRKSVQQVIPAIGNNSTSTSKQLRKQHSVQQPAYCGTVGGGIVVNQPTNVVGVVNQNAHFDMSPSNIKPIIPANYQRKKTHHNKVSTFDVSNSMQNQNYHQVQGGQGQDASPQLVDWSQMQQMHEMQAANVNNTTGSSMSPVANQRSQQRNLLGKEVAKRLSQANVQIQLGQAGDSKQVSSHVITAGCSGAGAGRLKKQSTQQLGGGKKVSPRMSGAYGQLYNSSNHQKQNQNQEIQLYSEESSGDRIKESQASLQSISEEQVSMRSRQMNSYGPNGGMQKGQNQGQNGANSRQMAHQQGRNPIRVAAQYPQDSLQQSSIQTEEAEERSNLRQQENDYRKNQQNTNTSDLKQHPNQEETLAGQQSSHLQDHSSLKRNNQNEQTNQTNQNWTAAPGTTGGSNKIGEQNSSTNVVDSEQMDKLKELMTQEQDEVKKGLLNEIEVIKDQLSKLRIASQTGESKRAQMEKDALSKAQQSDIKIKNLETTMLRMAPLFKDIENLVTVKSDNKDLRKSLTDHIISYWDFNRANDFQKVKQSETIVAEIRKSSENLKAKIENVELQLAKFRKEVVLKADFDEYTSHLAEKVSLASLQADLEKLPTHIDLEREISKASQSVSDLKADFSEQLASKEELELLQENLKIFMAETYATTVNVDEVSWNSRQSVQGVEDKLKKTRKQMVEINDFAQDVEKLCKKKVDKQSLEKVKEEMKKFCQYEDLKELYDKIVPEMQSFEQTMSLFKSDHTKFEEMLKQYDVVLAGKVNKVSLIEVEKKIMEKFAKQSFVEETIRTYDARHQTTETTMNKMDLLIKDLNKNLSSEIHSAVRKVAKQFEAQSGQKKTMRNQVRRENQNQQQTTQQVHSNEKVVIMTTSESMQSLDSHPKQDEISRNRGQRKGSIGALQGNSSTNIAAQSSQRAKDYRTAEDLGFATDDPADMQMEDWLTLVKTKADKNQIESLQRSKANKVDSDLQMKAIDILHRQVSHVIILLLETTKQLINDQQESAASKRTKRMFIMEQIINVSNWIQEFDPQNINFQNMTLPQNLKTLDEYSKVVTKEYPRQNRLIELSQEDLNNSIDQTNRSLFPLKNSKNMVNKLRLSTLQPPQHSSTNPHQKRSIQIHSQTNNSLSPTATRQTHQNHSNTQRTQAQAVGGVGGVRNLTSLNQSHGPKMDRFLQTSIHGPRKTIASAANNLDNSTDMMMTLDVNEAIISGQLTQKAAMNLTSKFTQQNKNAVNVFHMGRQINHAAHQKNNLVQQQLLQEGTPNLQMAAHGQQQQAGLLKGSLGSSKRRIQSLAVGNQVKFAQLQGNSAQISGGMMHGQQIDQNQLPYAGINPVQQHFEQSINSSFDQSTGGGEMLLTNKSPFNPASELDETQQLQVVASKINSSLQLQESGKKMGKNNSLISPKGNKKATNLLNQGLISNSQEFQMEQESGGELGLGLENEPDRLATTVQNQNQKVRVLPQI